MFSMFFLIDIGCDVYLNKCCVTIDMIYRAILSIGLYALVNQGLGTDVMAQMLPRPAAAPTSTSASAASLPLPSTSASTRPSASPTVLIPSTGKKALVLTSSSASSVESESAVVLHPKQPVGVARSESISPQCRSLLQRASLGDPLTDAEQSEMRSKCN